MTINRFCSSVICHNDFLHVAFGCVSTLKRTHKNLYLRFDHCLSQILNYIRIILKNTERSVMQQLFVGVWQRFRSYFAWLSFLRLKLPKCRNKKFPHIKFHDKTGLSRSRTRDLPHPKRESLDQQASYTKPLKDILVLFWCVAGNDRFLPVVHVSDLFHFPCCRLSICTINSYYYYWQVQQ